MLPLAATTQVFRSFRPGNTSGGKRLRIAGASGAIQSSAQRRLKQSCLFAGVPPRPSSFCAKNSLGKRAFGRTAAPITRPKIVEAVAHEFSSTRVEPRSLHKMGAAQKKLDSDGYYNSRGFSRKKNLRRSPFSRFGLARHWPRSE